MKYLLINLCALIPSLLMAASIYNTKTGSYVSEAEFLNQLPLKGHIVLGEYHYRPLIQKAQGEIIQKYTQAHSQDNNLTVAWEFLEYPNQDDIEVTFDKYKTRRLNDDELLKELFPNSTNPEQNVAYLPIFQAAKNKNAQLIGTNAPRSWKSVITKGGLSSLDPQYLPPNMQLGSKNYKARFKEAMGGHVPEDLVQNYFEAQCYTDSVMAWAINEYSQFDLRFLVVGSFHSDYNDGVVAELKRYSSLPTVSVKILERDGMTSTQIKQELETPHPIYGFLADYIYIVD